GQANQRGSHEVVAQLRAWDAAVVDGTAGDRQIQITCRSRLSKPELQGVAALEDPATNSRVGAEEPSEQAIKRDLTTKALQVGIVTLRALEEARFKGRAKRFCGRVLPWRHHTEPASVSAGCVASCGLMSVRTRAVRAERALA